MINWLFINEGVVVHIVEQADTPTRDNCPVEYDTVAQDDSKTFVVGEEFTAEKQREYNATIWGQPQIVSAPEFIERNGARYQKIT
jgi:hypothetical protein